MKPTASLLVAYRDDDGSRAPLWDWVRERIDIEYPWAEVIVEEPPVGVFNKSLAINRAAARATTNCLIIWDADTFIGANHTRHLIEMIGRDECKWGLPWKTKVKMGAQATAEFIAQPAADWDGKVHKAMRSNPQIIMQHSYAPPLVLPRKLFERVNGLDERMVGHGLEDTAFGIACDITAGDYARRPGIRQNHNGVAIHLYHELHRVTGLIRWKGQTGAYPNAALFRRYAHAGRNPAEMKELCFEDGHRT